MLILGLTFFATVQTVWAAPGTDSLVGYWKFDGNASDASGDGSTGSLSGTTLPGYDTLHAPTMFPNSQSLNLNTANGYVSFANQPGLKPTSALTFSLWINPSDYPANAMILGGQYLSGYAGGYFFKLDSAAVSFVLANGATPTTVSMPITLLPIGQWSLLTARWDGTNIHVYLNGALKSTGTFSGPPSYINGVTATSTMFQFNSFPGLIDDVRLYKRALSPIEISELAAGKHTSATWIGAQDQHYGIAANWSPNVVPDPYTHVAIPAMTNQPQFDTSEGMASLAIDTNAGLDIKNYNLSINDGGTFSNDGTLLIANLSTQMLTGFANDIDSGTIKITSPAATFGLQTGNDYYNLVINSPTGVQTDAGLTINNDLLIENGFLKLGAELLVKKNMNIASGGTLDVSTGNYGITLNGDWNNTGSFLARNGTVTLMGTNQHIYGSNTFYNLSKTVSLSDTLTFEAGRRQTITHTLQLLGAGSANQYLSLRSSTPGTQWEIDPQGTRDISSLNVQDGKNVNATPIAAAGFCVFNQGNNLNWSFDITAPTIALDVVTSPTNDNTPTITGTVSDTESSIVAVQYQTDTTSGTWNDCIATDGSFDSLSEAFFCTTALMADGEHTIYFRAKDTDGSQTPDTSFPTATIATDTLAPVISMVHTTPSNTGATITWTTNEPSSTKVQFGLTSTYDNMTDETDIPTGVTAHAVVITGLSTCASYHFQVYSKDNVSQSSSSADATFATTGCDITPPAITVNTVATPTSNNQPAISGTATDDASPVDWVKYQVDSISGSWKDCSASDTVFDTISESFSCAITPSLADGAHTVYFKAQDSKGNSSTTFSSVAFSVDTTGPGISRLVATPSDTGATITWTTDEDASSSVSYGSTATYGTTTTEADTAPRVTAHRVPLSGLTICTTYHYRALSKDMLGAQSSSVDATFTTTGCVTQDTSEKKDECADVELEAPDLYRAEATSETSIKIFFRDGKGSEDHFSVQYGTHSGSYRQKKSDIGGKDTNSYTVKDLDPDTKYYFRVRAVNDCLDSDWSDERSARTLAKETTTEEHTQSTPLSSNPATTPDAPTAPTTQPTTPRSPDEKLPSASPEPIPSNNATSSEPSSSFNPGQLSTSLAGALEHDPNEKNSSHFESPKEKGETRADLCKVEHVEMIQDQGRKKLTLRGTGPANTTLTVFVYSEVPTVLSVTTDRNGNWSYVLDKTLEDGEHQVYVAVTDTAGKISVKSEPLFFVKTAQAVRVIPPAEASGHIGSSTKKRSSQALWWMGGAGVGALLLSIGGIGYVAHRRKQFDQQTTINDNPSA